MKNTQYTALVLEAYEDEVSGGAYFDGLALAYPDHSVFFQKCAALERTTAARLMGLLRKYQLTPAVIAVLEERGTLDARTDANSDWTMLMQQSIESYANYVTEFKALEAMGPAEDRAILAALAEHEVQLIAWMRAEAGL